MQAFTNLTSGSTLGATLELGSSGQALAQLSTAKGLTAKQANALAGLQIHLLLHATSGSLDEALATKTAPNVDVAIADHGTPYIEFRYVDQNLYIQAKIRQILALIGQSQAPLNQALSTIGHLPPFLRVLVSGGWIELSHAELSQLGSLFSQTAPSPSLPPNAGQTLLHDLEQLFTKDVRVTETDQTDSGGTYTLTGNIRTLVTDFLHDVTSLAPGGLTSASPQVPTGSIPDKTLTLHANVADNKVTQLSFDAGQLASTSQPFHAEIDVNFSTANATISPPPAATTVNLNNLGSLFGRLMGGAVSSGSGHAVRKGHKVAVKAAA